MCIRINQSSNHHWDLDKRSGNRESLCDNGCIILNESNLRGENVISLYQIQMNWNGTKSNSLGWNKIIYCDIIYADLNMLISLRIMVDRFIRNYIHGRWLSYSTIMIWKSLKQDRIHFLNKPETIICTALLKAEHKIRGLTCTDDVALLASDKWNET